MSAPIRILTVCLGNICRSPSAQGVLEKIIADSGLCAAIEVDSAGTANYHSGSAPDARAIAAAAQRGVDLSAQRARQLCREDFERFDYILVMDRDNLANAKALQPADSRAVLDFFMAHCTQLAREVPDPYYGGDEGFEQVLDMLRIGGEKFVAYIAEKHRLSE